MQSWKCNLFSKFFFVCLMKWGKYVSSRQINPLFQMCIPLLLNNKSQIWKKAKLENEKKNYWYDKNIDLVLLTALYFSPLSLLNKNVPAFHCRKKTFRIKILGFSKQVLILLLKFKLLAFIPWYIYSFHFCSFLTGQLKLFCANMKSKYFQWHCNSIDSFGFWNASNLTCVAIRGNFILGILFREFYFESKAICRK